MKKSSLSSQKKLAVTALHPGGLLADVRELIAPLDDFVIEF
jgi:hypothetical protein